MTSRFTLKSRPNPECQSIALPSWFVHDLAQPINALNLSLQERPELNVPPGRQSSLVAPQWISQSIAELNMLLRSVREYFRLESGQVSPARRAVSLNEIVSKVISNKPLPPPRKLLSTMASETLSVISNHNLLITLIDNIYENAVRYARSSVSITASVHDGQASIAISDDGPGIEDEIVKQLGMPFIRGKTPETGDNKGFGLGIHIAAQIAEKLGHLLEFQTSPSGTTVTLTMAQASEAAISASFDLSASDPFLGKRVLTIDTDVAFADSLNKVLESWGCTTAHANCIIDAEKQDLYPADILITDIKCWQDASRESIAACAPFVLLITRENSDGHSIAPTFDKASGNHRSTIQRPFSALRLRRILGALLGSGHGSAD